MNDSYYLDYMIVIHSSEFELFILNFENFFKSKFWDRRSIYFKI